MTLAPDSHALCRLVVRDQQRLAYAGGGQVD